MFLINCEINVILTWSENCVITNLTGVWIIKTNDAKLYDPVITASTQNNAKLLKQINSGLKRMINQNKYQSNVEQLSHYPYLNHLIDPNFQEVNKRFVLSFSIICVHNR